ncbi:MAG: hypothetical protein LBS71_01215 [Puniceicoccales bacterium]|jgi:hypothetical protein|nr:hypothetical protein [Puniceicoccales bacterium]
MNAKVLSITISCLAVGILCASSPDISVPKRHKYCFRFEEDQRLINLVRRYGTDNWKKIASQMPGRNPRQCQERWKHYVNPEIQNAEWTPEEDSLLMEKVQELKGRWTKIAKFFKNRSDIQIKKRWQMLKSQDSELLTDSDIYRRRPPLPLPPPAPPIQSPDQDDVTLDPFYDISRAGDSE